MTPYIIIATMHTYHETGINSRVMSHGLKTAMEDAVDFVKTTCNAHSFAEPVCDFISQDGRLTTYKAKYDTGLEHGWVEFEIWKEKDIEC